MILVTAPIRVGKRVKMGNVVRNVYFSHRFGLDPSDQFMMQQLEQACDYFKDNCKKEEHFEDMLIAYTHQKRYRRAYFMSHP